MKYLNTLSVIIVIIATNFLLINGEISDKRLCADPNCSEIISFARSLIRYVSAEKGILSFNPNANVKILSKSAGTRPDLWGAEIGGRRGYIPKDFVRETKVLVKTLDHEVPTELKKNVEVEGDGLNEKDNANQNTSNEIGTLQPREEAVPAVQQSGDVNVVADASVEISNETLNAAHEQLLEKEVSKDNTDTITDSLPLVSTPITSQLGIGVSAETLDSPKPDPSIPYDIVSGTTLLALTPDENLPKTEPEKNIVKGNANLVDEVNIGEKEIIKETSLELEEEEDDSNDDGDESDDGAEDDEEDESVEIIQNGATEENKQVPENTEALDVKPTISEAVGEKEIVNDNSEFSDKKEEVEAAGQSSNSIDKKAEVDVKEDLVEAKIQDITDGLAEVKLEVSEIQHEIAENEANIVPENSKLIEPEDTEKAEEPNVPLVSNNDSVDKNITESGSANNEANEDKQIDGYVAVEELPKVVVEIENRDVIESVANVDLLNENVKDNTDSVNILNESENEPKPPIFNNPYNLVNNYLLNSANKVAYDEKDNELTTDQLSSDQENNNKEEVVNTTDPIEENVNEDKENATDGGVLLTENENISNQENLSSSEINDYYQTPEHLAYTESMKVEYIPPTVVPQIVTESSFDEPEIIDNLAEQHIVTEQPTIMDDIVNVITENKVEALGKVNDDDVGVGSFSEVVADRTQETAEIVVENNEPGFFANLFGGLFGGAEESKETINEEHNKNDNIDHYEDGLISHKNTDEDFCTSDLCPSPTGNMDFDSQEVEPEKLASDPIFVNEDLEYPMDSNTILIYLAVTAATVLLFTLGHYYIEKLRQDGSLLGKVNSLERALMVSTKECLLLKDNLNNTCEKLNSIKEGAFGSNEEVISLKEEKDKLQQAIIEKEEQIQIIEKELESATETGLELNKMLQDVLSTQKSDTITESVEQMQTQLNEQKVTINTMNAALATKSRENSSLQIQTLEDKKRFQTLETQLAEAKAQCITLQEQRDLTESQMDERTRSLQVQLGEAVEEKICEVSRLSEELQALQSAMSEIQKQLEDKTSQVQLLEKCVGSLKSGSSVDIQALANVSQLQAELQRATKNNETLLEQLSAEQDARKLLDDHVKVIGEQVSTLKIEHHQAERDKLEAQTRLEVLSSYFKEKETQLQKELGVQEALWQQKQGEATSTVERLHSMQDEIQTLNGDLSITDSVEENSMDTSDTLAVNSTERKREDVSSETESPPNENGTQNEALRNEIEQQTSAHRIQVTALESRAHEAWLGARQAERRLEESKAEAGILRRKLTSIAEQESIQKRVISPLDGDMNATSPLHMESPVSPHMPPPHGPPPPHPFLPPPFLPPPIGAPPFLPPFMGDMRPPPLGRLPSPPPRHYSPSMASDRYSPESRAYSPDRDYMPHSYHRRSMSPCETETDISPPMSPYGRYNNSYSQRRDEPRRSKGGTSGGSTESVNRNHRIQSGKV